MFGLNLDYLIINYRCEFQDIKNLDTLSNSDFILLLQKHSTKNFSKVGVVKYKGRVLGILTFDPYAGSVLKDSFCQFQVDNRFLYEPMDYLRAVLTEFMGIFNLVFEGFNRIDLAIDVQNGKNTEGGPVANWLYNLQAEVDKDRIIFSGREKAITYYTSTKKKFSGFSFGLRSSDRFIRFYNKTQELQERENKPHIRDFWENHCGIMDNCGDVFRFEVQLNRRFLTSIDEFSKIFNRKFQYSIMKISLMGYFDPRSNNGVSRVSNMPKLDPIQWGQIEGWVCGMTKKKQEFFEKAARIKQDNETNNLLRNKIMLKRMFFRYLNDKQENNLPVYFINEILKTKNDFDFRGFLYRKIKIWVAEFHEKYESELIFNEKMFLYAILDVSKTDFISRVDSFYQSE
jgi:hypothetical protein